MDVLWKLFKSIYLGYISSYAILGLWNYERRGGDKMYCPNCGEKRNHRRICEHCGFKYKKKNILKNTMLVLLLLVIGVGTTYFLMGDDLVKSNLKPAQENGQIEKVTKLKEIGKEKEKEPPTSPKAELTAEQETDLTDIIAAAQESVYTIYTYGTQGSGFLYNNNGAVVTNAHVVEGEINVYVKTMNGEELPGTVIGYSNETDVTVIHVPDLVGKNPYPLELNDSANIGEEVIALGSPLGLENTATMGYVTGKNRNFTIDNYTYHNIYQMSAPIAAGSSGGPLVSKESEKIVAINSAASTLDYSIGFSIPLYKIVDLVQSWIDNPMSEEEILTQFYNADGNFFFEDLWEYGDGYFDGGEYSDEDSYYDYWEYDYESFWDDYESDEWDYDEEFYDDEEYDWYEEDNYDDHDVDWYDDGYEWEDEGDWYEEDEGYDENVEEEIVNQYEEDNENKDSGTNEHKDSETNENAESKIKEEDTSEDENE